MKSEYSIDLITKDQAKTILKKYHYLSSISRGFKSGKNYGLIKNNEIVGVCIFTGFPVSELVQGMFGLPRTDQQGFFELSRLCLVPEVQSSEHNITSWFVARAIRALRKSTDVRALLSYADDDFHGGTIYKALGFKYYGLTTPKKDFWFLLEDGTYKKHSRGKTKGIAGEWRPRSRKHRFLFVYDSKLEIRWEQQKYTR